MLAKAVAALLMLVLAVADPFTYPQSAELPTGYATEVLAFEFAKAERRPRLSNCGHLHSSDSGSQLPALTPSQLTPYVTL